MPLSRWATVVGRAAYAARAAVYVLVGAIALDAARRFDPAEPRGVSGALRALARQPGGRFLMALLVVGLAAQVVWRAVQATTQIEHPHGHAPRWTARFGWAAIGVFYAAVCYRAFRLMLRVSGSDGSGEERSLVTRALAHPAGRVILYGVAVGLVVFAVYEAWKVWRTPFLDDFESHALTPRRRRLLAVVGRIGIGGRGLMFGAAGVLLARSAWRARADTLDAGDVLRQLMSGPFGQPLVVAIAVGLFAYAMLMVGEAAWRRNVREPRV